jgi:hypothetical protein
MKAAALARMVAEIKAARARRLELLARPRPVGPPPAVLHKRALMAEWDAKKEALK